MPEDCFLSAAGSESVYCVFLSLFCQPGWGTKVTAHTHLCVAKELGQQPAWRRPLAGCPLLPPQQRQCPPGHQDLQRDGVSVADALPSLSRPESSLFWKTRSLWTCGSGFCSLARISFLPIINYLHAQDRHPGTYRRVARAHLSNLSQAAALKGLAKAPPRPCMGGGPGLGFGHVYSQTVLAHRQLCLRMGWGRLCDDKK